jgi:quinol monooxygenase YgiN
MIRRQAPIAAALALAAVFSAAPAFAQTKPAQVGITIVIPLNAIGASRESSVKSMQAIAAVIRKQPGLIDEVLMEHKNPANKPSHVHVMRWQDMKNWEVLIVNPEFQKALQAHAATVQVQDAAGVYTPVK